VYDPLTMCENNNMLFHKLEELNNSIFRNQNETNIIKNFFNDFAKLVYCL